MLTIEKLKEFGVNTEEGLGRCLNNESFYLNLVKIGLNDEGFSKLELALKDKNLDKAFEIAHALKGVMGNLAIAPIYEVISEMTEELRSRKQIDYSPILNRLKGNRDKFLSEVLK